MNFMLCLGHFCEIHGPTSILCSQAVPVTTPNPSQAISSSTSTCLSCQLIFPAAKSSSYSLASSIISDTSGDTPNAAFGHPVVNGVGDSNGDGESTTSPGLMRTDYDRLSVISMPYPLSASRFTAIRQACVRSLSSEQSFSEASAMMFSDSSVGSVIAMIFRVGDESSRGHNRKYALMCMSDDELQLVRHWGLIVGQFEQIVKSIQQRATLESDRDDSKIFGPARYLRKRDLKQPPKSLVSILKNDLFFVEIHAKFARLLATIYKLEDYD